MRSVTVDPSTNRLSWESPKLSSRIEEEDPADAMLENEKIIKTPEPIVKQEKESLASKLMNFRKGS